MLILTVDTSATTYSHLIFSHHTIPNIKYDFGITYHPPAQLFTTPEMQISITNIFDNI